MQNTASKVLLYSMEQTKLTSAQAGKKTNLNEKTEASEFSRENVQRNDASGSGFQDLWRHELRLVPRSIGL